MLLSRTEVLAHQLRRQDLLTQARHDRILLAHLHPVSESQPGTTTLRRTIGAALVQAGERLRGPVVPGRVQGRPGRA